MTVPEKIKARLKAQLIQDEDVELYPYLDTEAKLTIGAGRNLSDNGITPDEAMYLLDNDVAKAYANAVVLFGEDVLESWGEARLCAVLNMIFNLGMTRFRKFVNTIRALKAGDWNEAANQAMESKWAKQVGSRAERIAKTIREGA